jgi:hypothetical protein
MRIQLQLHAVRGAQESAGHSAWSMVAAAEITRHTPLRGSASGTWQRQRLVAPEPEPARPKPTPAVTTTTSTHHHHTGQHSTQQLVASHQRLLWRPARPWTGPGTRPNNRTGTCYDRTTVQLLTPQRCIKETSDSEESNSKCVSQNRLWALLGDFCSPPGVPAICKLPGRSNNPPSSTDFGSYGAVSAAGCGD